MGVLGENLNERGKNGCSPDRAGPGRNLIGIARSPEEELKILLLQAWSFMYCMVPS